MPFVCCEDKYRGEGRPRPDPPPPRGVPGPPSPPPPPNTPPSAPPAPPQVFLAFFLMDMMLWGKHASNAVPATTMLALLALWSAPAATRFLCAGFMTFRASVPFRPVFVPGSVYLPERLRTNIPSTQPSTPQPGLFFGQQGAIRGTTHDCVAKAMLYGGETFLLFLSFLPSAILLAVFQLVFTSQALRAYLKEFRRALNFCEPSAQPLPWLVTPRSAIVHYSVLQALRVAASSVRRRRHRVQAARHRAAQRPPGCRITTQPTSPVCPLHCIFEQFAPFYFASKCP